MNETTHRSLACGHSANLNLSEAIAKLYFYRLYFQLVIILFRSQFFFSRVIKLIVYSSSGRDCTVQCCIAGGTTIRTTGFSALFSWVAPLMTLSHPAITQPRKLARVIAGWLNVINGAPQEKSALKQR